MTGQRPAPGWDPPEGCELAAVPDTTWIAWSGYRCRWGAGPRRKACGEPTVAAMRRSRYNSRTGKTGTTWWAYCAAHLYGRWVEDGVVMHWIAREIPPAR